MMSLFHRINSRVCKLSAWSWIAFPKTETSDRFSSNHEITNVIANRKWCQLHDLPHSTKTMSTTVINAHSLFIPAILEGLCKIRVSLYGNQAQGKQSEWKSATRYSYPLQNNSSTVRLKPWLKAGKAFRCWVYNNFSPSLFQSKITGHCCCPVLTFPLVNWSIIQLLPKVTISIFLSSI